MSGNNNFDLDFYVGQAHDFRALSLFGTSDCDMSAVNQSTVLALKYTHPTGSSHTVLAYTGKSGLTPVTKEHFRADYDAASRLEEYQRLRLCGFTTLELHEIEAFAPTYGCLSSLLGGVPVDLGFEAGILDNFKLHYIFDRALWRSDRPTAVPRFLLAGGKFGYWEAGNDKVWEILYPALCIATQFLNSYLSTTWFRALVSETYENIEEGIPDKWKGGRLMKFSPGETGSQVNNKETERKLQMDLDSCLENITFDIGSGLVERRTGLARKDNGIAFGLTGGTERDEYGELVTIAFEMLVPLMRSDLTHAERRIDQTRVAITILHEICHAMWSALRGKHGKNVFDPEPYFAEDPISELGFSMQEHVFGGTDRGLSKEWSTGGFGPARQIPNATLMQYNWHNKSSTKYNKVKYGDFLPVRQPFPKDWEHQNFFPIPISYTQNLWKADFWRECLKYPEMIKMGPKRAGVRRVVGEQPFVRLIENDYDYDWDWMQPISDALPLAEREALQAENLRRKTAQTIQHQLGDPIHALPLVEPSPPINPCPRYDEIAVFLLDNRSQNHLCFDTMEEEYPEHTILNHILLFSAKSTSIAEGRTLDITPEEWHDFLSQADNRATHEYFFHVPELGRGTVQWLPKLPDFIEYPVDTRPSTEAYDRVQNGGQLADEIMEFFKEMVLLNGSPWKVGRFKDLEFDYLLKSINRQIRTSEKIGPVDNLTEGLLKMIIDNCEVYEKLFRWGPNGVVRMIQADFQETSQSFVSSIHPRSPTRNPRRSSPRLSEASSPAQSLSSDGSSYKNAVRSDDGEDGNEFGVPRALRPF